MADYLETAKMHPGGHAPAKLAEEFARAEETTAPELHLLAQHPHPDVLSHVASHLNTSGETLDLIHSRIKGTPHERDIHRELIQHPNASSKLVTEGVKGLDAESYHTEVLGYPKADPKVAAQKFGELAAGDKKAGHGIETAADHYFSHPKLGAGEIDKYIKHDNPRIAMKAALSVHAKPEHLDQLIKHPKLNIETAHELTEKSAEFETPDSPRLSEKQLKDIYNHKGLQAEEKENSKERQSYYGRSSLRDIHKQILQHENAPQEIIDHYVNSKDEEGYYSNDNKVRALAHPKTPIDTVNQMAKKGDESAVKALLGRHDAPEETLRNMDAGIDAKGKEKERRWQYSNHVEPILQHPNYPKDLQMKRAKGDATQARAILAREDLDPEVLGEVLKNKNTNVAIEALKHKNITPELVKQAAERKSKDVSTAALNHPLLPKEIKQQKIPSDPKRLKEMAIGQHDPETYHAILDKAPTNHEVMDTLSKNKEAPASVLNKIIDAYSSGQIKSERGYDEHLPYSIARHPNLDREGRMKLLLNMGSGAGNPNHTAEDIKQALAHHTRNPSREGSLKSIAQEFLTHPNLTPEIAKELVTGKHGKLELERYGEGDKINKRPDIFTKEVVDAGLKTQPEFLDDSMAKKLSESPHLTADELHAHWNDSVAKVDHEDDNVRSNAEASLLGIVGNPNTSKKTLIDAIKASPRNRRNRNNELQELALEHPNLGRDGMKEIVDSGTMNTPAITKQLEEYGMKDYALENHNHAGSVVSMLHKDNKGRYAPAELEKALSNTHPDVIPLVLEEAGSTSTHKNDDLHGGYSQDERKQLFDKFLGSPMEKYAFPLMSNAAKDKLFEKSDIQANPDLVNAMNQEQLARTKITKGMNPGTAENILRHPNFDTEHVFQALEHSPHIAAVAAEEGNLRLMSQGRHQEFLDKAYEKYPEHNPIIDKVAKHSGNPKHIDDILTRASKGTLPDSSINIMNLVENHRTKAEDFDSLIKKDPLRPSDLLNVVNSKKASVKLLSHLAKTMPEIHGHLAASPKAGSERVLKHLIKGDVKTRIHLVNNPKISEETKTKLLEDPAVLLAAQGDMVTDEALMNHAESDNPDIVGQVLAHRKTTDSTANKAMRHLLKMHKEKPGDRDIIGSNIQFGLNHRQLPADILKEASDTSKEAAERVLRSQNNVPSNLITSIMDKHPNDRGVLEGASKHLRNNNEVLSKFIDQVDLDSPLEGMDRYGIHSLFRALDDDDDNKIPPETIEKMYAKYKQARPVGYDYSKQAPHLRSQDKSFVRQISRVLAGDHQDELMTNPNSHDSLAQNPNLKPENYNKLLDTYLKTTGEDDSHAGILRRLAENPVADSASLDKIHKWVKGSIVSPQDAQDITGAISNSPKISPELADEMFKDQPENILKNSAVKKEQLAKITQDVMQEKYGTALRADHFAHNITKNPNFSLKDTLDVLSKAKPETRESLYAREATNALYRKTASNYFVKPEDIRLAYAGMNEGDGASGRGWSQDILKSFINNPNTPADIMEDIVKNPSVHEDDLLNSPAIGGKLFRAKPISFPQGPANLKKGLESNEAVFVPHEAKIKSVVSKIPKDGFVEWANFKKENPGLANNPVIQKMFTSAPKQRLTKEHADEYLKNVPGIKKFHVSYDKWGKDLQNHNGKPQLVIQINNGEQQDSLYQGKPTTNGIHQMVKESQYTSNHPVTPQTIGWVRLDTSDPDHWFIEEVQSDYNSGLKGEFHKFQKSHGTGKFQEYGIRPEEFEKSLSELEQGLQGWDKAAISHAIDLAKRHGVKNISMHSGKSKTTMNKGADAEVNNKYDRFYNKMPEEFGFKPDMYRNLPSANPSSREFKKLADLPMWTMSLEDKEKEMKKSMSHSERILRLREVSEDLRKAAKAGKLYISAPSLDSMKQQLGKFYYSPNIQLKEAGEGRHEVHNAKGKIDGVHVRYHKGRYRFESTEE